VLDDEPDIRVVASVNSLPEGLTFIEREEVNVVIVSVGLPDQGALTLTRQVVDRVSSTKVLVLGLAADDNNNALRYIEAGAAGYILKDSSLKEFMDIIRLAQRGEAQISTKMAGVMMERLFNLARMFSAVEHRSDGDARLTTRELEVLQFIGAGLTNPEIAARLVVEVGTVKNHVHSILEKLNVSNRDEAASYLAFIKR
jgi:DNA-binding NarL/FixJ family response regulator